VIHKQEEFRDWQPEVKVGDCRNPKFVLVECETDRHPWTLCVRCGQDPHAHPVVVAEHEGRGRWASS